MYPTMHLFQVFLAHAVSVIANSTEYFWEFCKKRIVGMLPIFRILLEFSVFQRLQFQKVHKMSSWNASSIVNKKIMLS